MHPVPQQRVKTAARAVVIAFVLCGTVGLAALSESGCRDEVQPVGPRRSQRNEACQITADCAEGLSCAPLPGGALSVCVTGAFRVRPTSKECVLLECVVANDCCDPSLTVFCLQQQQACAVDAGDASQQSCITFQKQCGCATGQTVCEEGKCRSNCRGDEDCVSTGAGQVCIAGRCARCATNTQCPGGQQCNNGKCESFCGHDGQCAGFDRCVEGRCLASGCQTDRECIASTRNVDARCGTDGKCIIPCETDLECGDPASYSFFSCIQKQCTYVGCESDKDCRLFYTGPSDASVLPPGDQVVCRERSTLGDVTKPAQ
jgi:hypothetical protein